MEHHSMNAGEFEARYGVTPQEVQDALEENRRRVTKKLSEWGYGWAVDEILCDVTVELLKGGLRRWASYEDRKPLGAFVNTLIGNRLGEWMRTERPKYRSGMTHAQTRKPKKNNNDQPQNEPLDADKVRDRLRREDNAAAQDRLCEEAERALRSSRRPFQLPGMAHRRGPAHGTGLRRIPVGHEISEERMRETRRETRLDDAVAQMPRDP